MNNSFGKWMISCLIQAHQAVHYSLVSGRGVKLFGTSWTPTSSPLGLVYISHGYGEHMGYYHQVTSFCPFPGLGGWNNLCFFASLVKRLPKRDCLFSGMIMRATERVRGSELIFQISRFMWMMCFKIFRTRNRFIQGKYKAMVKVFSMARSNQNTRVGVGVGHSLTTCNATPRKPEYNTSSLSLLLLTPTWKKSKMADSF